MSNKVDLGLVTPSTGTVTVDNVTIANNSKTDYLSWTYTSGNISGYEAISASYNNTSNYAGYEPIKIINNSNGTYTLKGIINNAQTIGTIYITVVLMKE